MKILILTFIAVFSFSSIAKDLSCSLLNQPGQSELLIEYEENTPQQLYLRSPGDVTYRKQMVTIEVISARADGPMGQESFITKPIPPTNIPWDTIEECYVPIGTLWYFQFNHDQTQFRVSFVPDFATETDACITPRFRPQTHQLDCRTR